MHAALPRRRHTHLPSIFSTYLFTAYANLMEILWRSAQCDAPPTHLATILAGRLTRFDQDTSGFAA